jgi:GT2 family glycosyltransferase
MQVITAEPSGLQNNFALAKHVVSVVVTYNGMQWIDRCLRSLLDSVLKTHIIVIDNGSQDETVSHISNHYPGVELILSPVNLGFGSANNIGLRKAMHAGADCVFLLNQDAWVEENTLTNLVTAAELHPEIGVLSPVHLNGKGDDFDDHFYEYLSPGERLPQTREILLKKTGVNQIIKVPFVNAAAWLIKFECFKKTGGFDPLFFHYGEDDNYGQRVRMNGFSFGVVMGAKIYHDRDRSTGGNVIPVHKRVHAGLTQFLVYAADLQRKHFRWFMYKRCIRHYFLAAVYFIRQQNSEAQFHFQLARRIKGSVKNVSKSRRIYADGRETPFL